MSTFGWHWAIALLLLLYLSSFVLLAVLRIATGLSVLRLGYLSLKRIVYTVSDDVRLEIRSLSVLVHRPTYTRPTWFTVRLDGLRVVNDPTNAWLKDSDRNEGKALAEDSQSQRSPTEPASPRSFETPGRARGLYWTKELLKRIQTRIDWLRFVDLELRDPCFVVPELFFLQLESCKIAVDTRHRKVERGRLFRHKEVSRRGRRPVEWILVFKNLMFAREGLDSIEVLDTCAINIHGLLQARPEGLRDTSISFKIGRVYVPYDDVLYSYRGYLKRRSVSVGSHPESPVATATATASMEPRSDEAPEKPTIADEEQTTRSKSLLSSFISGVQEIQLAASFIGASRRLHAFRDSTRPVYMNLALNEFGIDIFRLEEDSPAHRMYFPNGDMAHQVLLAAISITASLDDGDAKADRLVYIPMATTTVKTTLPLQVLNYLDCVKRTEPCVVIGNLVLTSPSLDLDLKRLPLMRRVLKERNQEIASCPQGSRRWLPAELMPIASLKVSIQEPVCRIVLPRSDADRLASCSYDMLILSISSISLELESQMAEEMNPYPVLSAALRISSQHLYYHTASNDKSTVLLLDALEIRLQMVEEPELSVSFTCNLSTFSVHLVRQAIVKGIGQILDQLRTQSASRVKEQTGLSRSLSLIFKAPVWLSRARVELNAFSIEIAGTDSEVSDNAHGIAIQTETCALSYVSPIILPSPPRRRTQQASTESTEEVGHFRDREPFPSPELTKQRSGLPTFACRFNGLNLFVVDGPEHTYQEPLLTAPKTDVSIFAHSHTEGPNCEVATTSRAVLLKYSLYNTYALLLAVKVIQTMFATSNEHAVEEDEEVITQPQGTAAKRQNESFSPQISTVFTSKVTVVQIKAGFPHDPCLLLRLNNFEHRSSLDPASWIKARLARLCTAAPGLTGIWQRAVISRNPRVDFYLRGHGNGSRTSKAPAIEMNSAFLRIAVPHQLVVHQVLDNFVDASKATKQLARRLELVSKNDDGRHRGLKMLPAISFRSKVLLFELEDGMFDWKLGLIYRVGLSEQKQRLAREEAFRVKERKLGAQSQHAGSNRYRSRAHGDRARHTRPAADGATELDSLEYPSTSKTLPSSGIRGNPTRYDVQATGNITNHADINPTDARHRLRKHDASNWRRRINFASAYQASAAKDLQGIFGGFCEPYDRVTAAERVLDDPSHPALLSVIISDFHVVVDKPSFPLDQVSSFLHQVGKGMPYEMEYSLLIPTSVRINMGETRATLRNYPLPLLHIPRINTHQSQRLPSWSLKSDFVVAEEYHGTASTRKVKIAIVAQPNAETKRTGKGLYVSISRTIAPVKTFSEVDIAINTRDPTGITWGTSYQPAIQDMMQVIEKFTKPRLESSKTMGFWDKIRLVFHSRIRIAWMGGGDVHLRLKGSRDPYAVSGYGAGFVMCFRDDVKWDIHQDDDPKKFMTVSCNEHILAIPDYSVHARQLSKDFHHQVNSHRQKAQHELQIAPFRKVIMKFTDRVRWLAGLVFERISENGHPAFEFKRHFDVVFSNQDTGRGRDALGGFRSDHLHLSLAVIAPVDRDWSIGNSTPSSGYNSMHTSPRFFTHFFDWWSLFSGAMSLPIRQGKLFAGAAKPSKKFGRHLATIKYNLLLSPFLVSHIYKHGQAMGESQGRVGVTGLKIRIDSFMLDLHQRREDFAMQGRGRLKTLRTSGMRINQAQLDFISADIRAISARFEDTPASFSSDQPVPSQSFAPSQSPEDMNTGQDSWIDAHDFVELDETPSIVPPIKTTIMPLAFSPHFTYIRQTDDEGVLGQDVQRSSHFGHEPTHFCIMSRDNDPRLVQQSLLTRRLAALQVQLEEIERRAGEQELRAVRDGSGDRSIGDRHELLEKFAVATRQTVDFVDDLARTLQPAQQTQPTTEPAERLDSASPASDMGSQQDADHDAVPMLQPLSSTSGFKNCFIIHNVQLKWNNTLRDTVLHYAHQVNQRRGFVYYMSRRAVKFIIDIVGEQQKVRTSTSSARPSDRSQPSPGLRPDDQNRGSSLEKRIDNILSDGKGLVDADDSWHGDASKDNAPAKLEHVSSEDFAAQDSYHLRLIAPQIQLQSKKSPSNVVLVTGREMELRVVQIMDKDRLSDDVSGLVQRRFSLDMDGVQFFVTNLKSADDIIFLEALEPYGASTKSKWPPWAPLETNFDFETVPFGLARVVQKTSASLRYDRYNNLRLKYNSEIAADRSSDSNVAKDTESRMDHLWVNFPQIRAICDSSQYYAMYIIVLDLLLYSEPFEKIRNEKLEKIMLAADFSDLSGSPEMVADLQKRIRYLEEIRTHFQLHIEELDEHGKKDFSTVEQDLVNCEDELFFLMKAITSSQRKYDDRSPNSTSRGFLRWYLSASEIVWLMLQDGLDPLVEVQLREAVYERTDNSDGSNHNVMEIEQVRGLNLVPDASYPEMIAPFFEGEPAEPRSGKNPIKMFKVRWDMLEAIAGIPVLDQFEINLFPTRLQIEREIGERIFDYVFPSHRKENGARPERSSSTVLGGEDVTSGEETLTYEMGPQPLEHTHGLKSSRLFRIPLMGSRKATIMPQEPPPLSQSARRSMGSKTPEHEPESRHSQEAAVSESSKPYHPTNSPPSLETSHAPAVEDIRTVRWSERDASVSDASTAGRGQEKARRWELHRKGSRDSHDDRDNSSDDLTEMVTRASSFMTLAYVKIPSVVLCLSYKGRKDRNLEDVHDLVFRMPALEYRNKTWSNLDLALRLKRDVVKALISHTGAIIGNKLSYHRPQKQKKEALRDLAASSSMLLEDRSRLGVTPRTSTSSWGPLSAAGGDSSSRPSSVASWFGAGPGTRSSTPNLGSERPRKGSTNDQSPLSTPSFTSLSSSSDRQA